jgi:hypothetical protein
MRAPSAIAADTKRAPRRRDYFDPHLFRLFPGLAAIVVSSDGLQAWQQREPALAIQREIKLIKK